MGGGLPQARASNNSCMHSSAPSLCVVQHALLRSNITINITIYLTYLFHLALCRSFCSFYYFAIHLSDYLTLRSGLSQDSKGSTREGWNKVRTAINACHHPIYLQVAFCKTVAGCAGWMDSTYLLRLRMIHKKVCTHH